MTEWSPTWPKMEIKIGMEWVQVDRYGVILRESEDELSIKKFIYPNIENVYQICLQERFQDVGIVLQNIKSTNGRTNMGSGYETQVPKSLVGHVGMF